MNFLLQILGVLFHELSEALVNEFAKLLARKDLVVPEAVPVLHSSDPVNNDLVGVPGAT